MSYLSYLHDKYIVGNTNDLAKFYHPYVKTYDTDKLKTPLHLQQITENTFKYYPNLVYIRLIKIGIESIHSFGILQHLMIIEIKNELSLTTLPKDLFTISSKLNTVYIENTNINTLPYFTTSKSTNVSFILRNCKLTKLELSVFNNVQLLNFEIYSDELSEITCKYKVFTSIPRDFIICSKSLRCINLDDFEYIRVITNFRISSSVLHKIKYSKNVILTYNHFSIYGNFTKIPKCLKYIKANVLSFWFDNFKYIRNIEICNTSRTCEFYYKNNNSYSVYRPEQIIPITYDSFEYLKNRRKQQNTYVEFNTIYKITFDIEKGELMDLQEKSKRIRRRNNFIKDELKDEVSKW